MSQIIKASREFNARRFGVVGDGVNDDTAGAQAVAAAAEDHTRVGSGGIYGAGAFVGSAPTVKFDYGIVKLTGSITPDTPASVAYVTFEGEDTIVVAGVGVVAFGGLGNSIRLKRFQFRGGAIAASVNTASIDSSRVDIVECEFHRQSTACVKTTNSGAGTILNLERCKFIMDDSASSGHVLYLEQVDVVRLERPWIYAYTPVAIHNNAGQLQIIGGRSIPGGNLDRHIDNYYILDVDGHNFGGEAAGRTWARNYAPMDTSSPHIPTKLSFRNCYGSCGAQPIIEFHELPNIFEFHNNAGLIDTLGFHFDTGLDYVDFFNWQRYGQISVDSNYLSGSVQDPASLVNISTNGDIGLQVMQAAMARQDEEGTFIQRRARLKASEIFGAGGVSAVGGAPWTSNVVNVTRAFATDAYGLQGEQYTATADNATGDLFCTTYLNQAVLAYGAAYTLNLVLEVNASSAALFEITVGGAKRFMSLGTGRHVVGIPFVYLNNSGAASATYDTLDIYVLLRRSGDVVNIRRQMLLKGFVQYTSETLVLEGTGSPSAYTNGIGDNSGYVRGDALELTNTTGEGKYVCTVGGAPGTWVRTSKRGTFTMDNATSKTISDTAVTPTSVVLLMPTNAAAASLQQAPERLYVSTRTAATSFVVSTQNASAAGGTETFEYVIVNP